MYHMKISYSWQTWDKQEIWANAHETRESLLQFLFAASISLSPSILLHFTLLQPKIAQNYKILNFLGSRSCKVIDVDIRKKSIVSAC